MSPLMAAIKLIALVVFIGAMITMYRANSRLIASRDRSRSIFSPMHTLHALKSRDFYVLFLAIFIGWVAAAIAVLVK